MVSAITRSRSFAMDSVAAVCVCLVVLAGQLSPVCSQAQCGTSETCDFTVTTAGVQIFIVDDRDYCFNCTSSPADWMVEGVAAGDLNGLQVFSNGILEVCDVGAVTEDVGGSFNVECGDGLVYMLRSIRVGDPVVDPVAPVHEGMNVTLSCARGINTIGAVYSISWIDPSGTVLVEEVGASSLEHTVVGITRDQAGDYTCSVAVSLEGSLANQTSTVTVTVYSPPDPPTNLIVLESTEDSISLSWTNGFDGSSELTGAVVRYQAEYPGDPLRELTVDTPPFDSASLTSLTPYTTYTITVSLVNAIGEGGSISISTTTLSLVLQQPVLTLTTLSSQELSAEWMLSSYNASTTAPPTSWMLTYERRDKETMDYVDPKIETLTAASPPSPLFQQSFNLTGLEKGTEYRARVVGFNVRGEGLVSAYVVAETSDSTRGLATGVDMAISVTLTALVVFFLGVVY